jgi:hypothetical protein
MATCPVCQNKSAEISSSKRIPGRSDAAWYVKCKDCPVPFEIPGSAWNLVVTNPRELERRRPQWVLFLRQAKERGDSFAKLY